MSDEIIVSIIGSSVILAGIITSIVMNIKKTNKLLLNSSRQNEYNTLNKKLLKVETKLYEFYYPMRSYLEKSRNIYDVFKANKPENFRTLTYLLDKEQLYIDNKYQLSINDKAYLKQIFEVGIEIEKIIAEKESLLHDSELVKNYSPSKLFVGDDAGFPYPKNKSLLSIAQIHLSFIRMAFDGEINGDGENLSPYVFPRELNYVIDNEIKDLEKELNSYNISQEKLILKMGSSDER